MKHSFKTLLTLALALVAGNAWGETVTSTFRDKNWKVGQTEEAWTATGATATAIETSGSARGVQVTLANIKKDGLTLTNTSIKDLGAISKVEIVYSSNCGGNSDGTIAVAVGSTAFGSAFTIKKENNATISFENETAVEGDIVITFTSTATSKSVYVKSITVTYGGTTPPARTLKSIYIDGTATELEYFAGDEFDPAGLKVMGKYDTGDDTEITQGIVWSFDPETLSLGTTSVSVTAKVENFVSAPFEVTGLTVNEHVITPGTYTFGTDWNSVFGTSHDGSFSARENELRMEGEVGDITMVVTNGASTNGYMKTGDFRLYNGYTMTLSAPTGYNITSITATKSGKTISSITADCGSLTIASDGSSMEWTGASNTVTFSAAATTGFASISVTFAVSSKTLTSVAVSGTPTKTSYKEGDAFDPAGLVVTGTYDDASTDDTMASQAAWSCTPATLTEGTTSVTVTATVNGITSDAYVVNGITVEAKTPTGNFALYTGTFEEGDYVIYYNGNAMKASVSSNRLDYESVTPTGNVIAEPDASIVWHIAASGDYYTIYNAAEEKYAASNGTKNQAALVASETDNALWSISYVGGYEFVNKVNAGKGVNANLRNNSTYGFACYSTSTGGALKLYKKTDAATPVREHGATITSAGFATLYLDFAAAIPTGVTAYTAVTGEDAVTLTEIEDVIPAETAIVLEGAAGTYTFEEATTTATAPANNLVGTLTATDWETVNNGQYIYVLGQKDGVVGFYKLSETGTIKANSAYLALDEDPASGSIIIRKGDATAISLVQENGGEAVIYDLLGRRVSEPMRGIYIVNGKKMFIK